MNTDDRDLTRFLLQLTLLPVEEALAVVASHEADPGGRHGQRRLAHELTALVHGASHAAAAAEASAALFGGEVTSGAAYEALAVDMPTTTVKTNDLSGDGSLVDLLLSTGLSSSKGDARRALAEGSVYVHGERRSEDYVAPEDLRFGRYLLLRRGKRNYTLVISE
jgi:tyrosyl-tRNA synthetase